MRETPRLRLEAIGPEHATDVERDSSASRRVMEHLGMVSIGKIRAPGVVEGHSDLRDDAPFAVYATRL